LYGFDIPNSLDFIKDVEILESLKNEIITKIQKLNDHSYIKGWSLKDNVWPILKYRFNHYDFLHQEEAYLQWLKGLIDEIKKVDARRFVIQDVVLSQFSIPRIKRMQKIDIKIDALGLNMSNDYFLNDFLKFAEKRKFQYIISSIKVPDLIDNQKRLANKSIFIESWQNQWETKQFTLDGLLDFRGNKKSEYYALAKMWGVFEDSIKSPIIRILKPSVRLIPGTKVTYHALLYKNGKWVNPSEKDQFEWMFLKYDDYDSPLAIKSLGFSSKITITVPQNNSQFGILLNYSNDRISKSETTTLNTQLHSSISELD